LKEYQIRVYSLEQFKDVLKLLFYRGHVFTSKRHKNYKEIESHWGGRDKWWYYIQVGGDSECEMVLNASMCRVSGILVIEPDDFLGMNYE
jgi:hypothetical protein